MLLRNSLQGPARRVFARVQLFSVNGLKKPPGWNRPAQSPELQDALNELAKYSNEKNTHLFAASLRNVCHKFARQIDRTTGKSVLALLSDEFISTMDHEAVYILNGLSKLNVNCAAVKERDVVLNVIRRINRLESGINNVRLCTAASAMARMGISYGHPRVSNVLQYFLMRLVKTVDTMEAREIVQTLHDLQIMGVTTKILPPTFVKDVMETIIRVRPDIEDRFKASLLFSLSRLGFKSSTNDQAWRTVLFQMAEEALNCTELQNPYVNKRSKEMTTSFAIVTMGLSSMYIPFKDFPLSLQQKVLDSFTNAPNKTQFAYVIASAGRLKIDYQSLPYEVRRSILSQIDTYKDTFNLGDVCNVLTGLMGMKLQYHQLDSTMRDHLHALLQRAIPMSEFFNTRDRENIIASAWLDSVRLISGLGQMGVVWASLPPPLQSSIHTMIKKASLTGERLTSVLSGLAMMKVKWNELDSEVKDSMNLKLNEYEAYHEDSIVFLVPALSALGKMKALWSELPTNVLESCLCHKAQSINDVGLATVVLALGQMQASWLTLLPETQKILHELLKVHLPNFNEQMLANTASGLSLMAFDVPDGSDALLDEIHPLMIERLDNHFEATGGKCDHRFFTQIALYHAVLSIKPRFSELMAKLERHLDAADPSVFTLPIFRQRDLTDHANKICYLASKNGENTYTMETMQSHCKYGAMAVQMSFYRQRVDQKDKQLIGLLLTNGGGEGQKRRAFQMMKTVYSYHLPNVPLDSIAVRSNDDLVKKLREWLQ